MFYNVNFLSVTIKVVNRANTAGVYWKRVEATALFDFKNKLFFDKFVSQSNSVEISS